ncbi:MAG: acylneuraminate cytidylyltransferase family protein [Gammaproteobacteria bacterium]
MIKGKTVLAIIPARGGSKGIPKKNILPIGGKPLIVWTIEEANKSKYLDRIILSSDCNEIIDIAKNNGCEVPFVRPASLSSDTANSIDVVEHAISSLEQKYDYIVLLQPTSIFRISEDIDAALEACDQKGTSSCISVTECEKPPEWIYFIEDKKLLPLVKKNEQLCNRRQDAQTTYHLNGAVYVVETDQFKKQRSFLNEDSHPYIMPKERSLDIDSFDDVLLAEAYLKK